MQFRKIPPTRSRWGLMSFAALIFKLGMNHPPTAGRWDSISFAALIFRLGMNHLRVGPAVAQPGPPQIRTCAIHASGSSVHQCHRTGTELELTEHEQPNALRWSSGYLGLGAHCLAQFSLQLLFCPASPSLQWVPWASVPHLLSLLSCRRLSVLCSAKTAGSPSRTLHSSLRVAIPCLLLLILCVPSRSARCTAR